MVAKQTENSTQILFQRVGDHAEQYFSNKKLFFFVKQNILCREGLQNHHWRGLQKHCIFKSTSQHDLLGARVTITVGRDFFWFSFASKFENTFAWGGMWTSFTQLPFVVWSCQMDAIVYCPPPGGGVGSSGHTSVVFLMGYHGTPHNILRPIRYSCFFQKNRVPK